MNDDSDVIGIIESRGRALVRCVVKIPFWRGQRPNEPVKIIPVPTVAKLAAWRGKIVLVPPTEFGLWRQWLLVRYKIHNDVPAYRNQRVATFRPKRSYDDGRPRSPIEAGEGCLLNLERVHQRTDIECNGRLLAVPKRRTRLKRCRPEAAQERNDDPVSRRSEQRGDIDVAVNVVRPAVQQDHGLAVSRSRFDVSNVQDTRIRLLQ